MWKLGSTQESQKHYVEQKKPDTEKHILYTFIGGLRTDRPLAADRNLNNVCPQGWIGIRKFWNGIKKLAIHIKKLDPYLIPYAEITPD